MVLKTKYSFLMYANFGTIDRGNWKHYSTYSNRDKEPQKRN